MRASTRAATQLWSRDERPSNENIAVVPPEVFGPYLVYEEIGVGGLATVHRAVEAHALRVGCERDLALKRLRPELTSDWELVTAFVNEAKLTSQLEHEHIARTVDFGRHEGVHYIAMDMVSGPSLRQVMKHCRFAAGAMPVPIVVEILAQLCSALAYVHSRSVRIVHRDVSPGNVIIARTGRVKLVDFGVAKTAQLRPPTEHGIIKGTVGYMAPETLAGDFDQRADLFAIGVLAHELLANRALFERATVHSTLARVRDKRVAAPSRWNRDVPHDLDDIVMTALQRDVDLRWQNAAAMERALRNVARDIGIVTPGMIHAWTSWAFAKRERRDTQIVRVLDQIV